MKKHLLGKKPHIPYNDKNSDWSKKTTSRDVGNHKKEGRSGITEYEKDEEKIRNFLSICIHPFDTENHLTEIVNIHSSKLSNKDVNDFTTHLVSRLKLCLSFRKLFEYMTKKS